MTLRMTSDVPPPIVLARERRKPQRDAGGDVVVLLVSDRRWSNDIGGERLEPLVVLGLGQLDQCGMAGTVLDVTAEQRDDPLVHEELQHDVAAHAGMGSGSSASNRATSVPPMRATGDVPGPPSMLPLRGEHDPCRRPAAVALADPVAVRHDDVVEEHLAEL